MCILIKKYMILYYGAINYKGPDWTEKDNLALFGLYYLAVASMAMPYFEKNKLGGCAT